MGRSSAEDKWENSDCHKEEEEGEGEEEEALSLCDLPVNLIKEETQPSKEVAQETEASQEDFDFVPWGGSLSTSSEMCAADDIFFQGQILPFRLSVSSESGLTKLRQDSLNLSRCASMSESMDRSSVGGFTSFSSRSSSSRSQFSSSSSCSVTTSTRISKPRIQNQFHTHPSPKPQIKLPTNSLGNAGSNRNRKSTIWEFFRLGLVHTPEIELQDLKVRTSVSRNSSSSSSNSNSSFRIRSNSRVRISSSSQNQENKDKQKKQSFLEKKSGAGGLLSGCSCTVSAVKSVPLNIIVIKPINSSGNSNNYKSKEKGSAEGVPQELKIKNKKKMVEKQQQQGKQAISRHRTFEWIKELSHASFLVDNEEEGLDS
ncbi:uncharacterized protein LOC110629097 [Manihot esculenta]|uniref:Uncharacterized protein n=8 Tax=Manihot esculenta TaxID=3983 RepID=A0ACB7GML3_MANES|nr:uncharacterized protein LOC110629097 [Manihot esculenta]XP_021631665.1 uncharacterized protein LOC110629097 [Manihot esculenta]XP_021631667.1 uncharacterized protein LOC110629097 [Manihot esculenta]XP_021631668.1 uncharacterized protein LOC110629097 [Manihot esculenta]KAG8641154.1 hypothetical protein MANES_13G114000v8 [Manihot esculenta]KAG8641155.1 hypothetical protein MANES_13G114000v8 [Manihot esculenta]KAG8641156.1 hypothetical protein MANES_13G114000v8 [Manihot esculenta]KAG8641157.